MDGVNQPGIPAGPGLNKSTPVEKAGQAFGDRKVSSASTESTKGLNSGPELSNQLGDRKVGAPLIKQQLAELLGRYAPEEKQENSRLLEILSQSDFFQSQLESDQPLTQEQIRQLEEMLPELREQVRKGNSVQNLNWRINGQLNRPVDLGNREQLSQLTRLNLEKFSAKIHEKAAQTPELVALASDIDQKLAEMDSLSPKDQCGQCHTLLEKMSPHLPESDREVARLLQTQVKSQALQEIKNEFKEQLHSKLQHLNRAGTEREVAVAVELGLAASAFGMDAFGAAVKLEYKFNAKSLDSTEIIDDHAFSASLNLSAGNNATIRGDAAITGTTKSGKMFKNLDDYINHHANDLMPLLLEKKLTNLKNLRQSAKGIRNTKKADQTGQLAKADLNRLQTMLQANGTLPANQKLTLPEEPEKKYLDTNTRSAKGSLTGSALKGMLSGEFHVSNTRTEYFQKHGWLETLKEEPEHLNHEPARYFSVQNYDQWLQGGKGEQWLDQMGKNIEGTKEQYNQATPSGSAADRESATSLIASQRDQLRESMASLYAEYDHYCATVNRLEDSGDKSLKADIRDLKHRMEKARGTNGRGEYLRAVTDTHAAMANLYAKTFRDGPPAESQDLEFDALQKKFEQDYTHPRIHLDEKKDIRKQLSSFSKAEGKDLEAGGSFRVSVGPTEVQAGFRVNEVSHHFNPDTEGRYLNVNFSAGVGTNPQQALTAVLKGLPKDSNLGGAFFVDSLPNNFSYGVYQKANFEVNFIWSEGGWRAQYMRASGQMGIGGGTPEATVPVAPALGLKGKVEAAVRGSNNVWERVGTDTLTYFFTRYNGWAVGGNHPAHWNEFKSHNPEQIKELFNNMADDQSCAAKELNKNLEKIGDKRLTEDLKSALTAFSQNPNDDNYLKTLELFDTFMEKQHLLYQSFVAHRFKAT